MSIFSERMDGANFRITRYNKPINILGKARALRKELNVLTLRMGKMSREHIENNFKAEGFVDTTLMKWEKKKKPNGKKTLIDTGRMKATTKIFKRTRNTVHISTPVSYAGIHNRPVTSKPKRYGTGLYPGRQFMGHSKVLAEATKKMIVTRINLALQV